MASKKKTPYEKPGSKNKTPSANVNTNLLHVDRITKDDKFLNQLKSIFSNKTSKNYTINCGSSSYQLDMFILAGRSQYFENMFLSQMKETIQLSIDIELPDDIKSSSLKTFLKYLYWDDLALPDTLDLSESMYLYECADFYQISNANRLKALCEERVKGEGKGDAEEVMGKAHLLGAKKIKKAASDIVRKR